MQAVDMFNYRDYVPAFVQTTEVKRLEDLLQADYSQSSRAEGKDNAQAVIAGLARVVAAFTANPVAQQVIDQVSENIARDLQAARFHQKELESMERTLNGMRTQAQSIQGAHLTRESKALLANLDNIGLQITAELTLSRRVSAAYEDTLRQLAEVTPKVLTPEELAALEWIERRQASLKEFQERVKNEPSAALVLAAELERQLTADPLPILPTKPAAGVPQTMVVDSTALRPGFNLPTLGGVAPLMGPALGGFAMGGLLAGLPGMVIGAGLGALSVAMLRRENASGAVGPWR